MSDLDIQSADSYSSYRTTTGHFTIYKTENKLYNGLRKIETMFGV